NHFVAVRALGEGLGVVAVFRAAALAVGERVAVFTKTVRAHALAVVSKSVVGKRKTWRGNLARRRTTVIEYVWHGNAARNARGCSGGNPGRVLDQTPVLPVIQTVAVGHNLVDVTGF